jgi:hypothetical protein
MEGQSTTGNHEGEIIGRGIIKKESLRRKHGGAIIEEGAWRNHLGSASEPSGKHLFGNHSGAFRKLQAEETSGRHLEVRSQKSQRLSSKAHKLQLNRNFTNSF